MKNPLIVAADKISEHLDTIKSGSVIEDKFISEHRALVENLQAQVETFLIEDHLRAEGYQTLQANYDVLRTKLKNS